MLKQVQHDIKPHTTHFTHDTHSKKAAFTLAEGATHVDMSDNIRRVAFTLAEVLITIGIIGIVAAMTIPTLISKYQEKVIVTSLKKTVATISQAYQRALYDNNFNMNFGYLDPEFVALPEDEGPGFYDKNGNHNTDVFYNALKKYLNIAKDCGREVEQGCFADTIVSVFDSSKSWDFLNRTGKPRRFFVLNDGTSIGFLTINTTSPTQTGIYIDVNGLKGPNLAGYDIFQVRAGANGLEHYDDMKDTLDCYTNPFSCAAWVINVGNLDYLHCDDLSWNGKHKCD